MQTRRRVSSMTFKIDKESFLRNKLTCVCKNEIRINACGVMVTPLVMTESGIQVQVSTEDDFTKFSLMLYANSIVTFLTTLFDICFYLDNISHTCYDMIFN